MVQIQQPTEDCVAIYSDDDSSDTDQFVGDEAYNLYKELLDIVRQKKPSPVEASTPEEEEEPKSAKQR